MRIVHHAGGFVSEFWKFAAKGNIFDLAIGVILGTAFSAIVNSLVGDVVMPLLSLLTGNINFAELSYTIRPAFGDTPAAVISYGKLIQAAINFVIIGLSIFVFFKLITNIRKRLERQEKAEPVEAVSTQEKLLSEIRDLLRAQVEKNERPQQ